MVGGGSLRVLRLLPPLKHVAMIFLKVALNTKNPIKIKSSIVSQLLYFVSHFSQSGLLKSNHISLIFGSCEHSEYMYMELLRSCEHSEYMYMELLRSCEHSEYMYMELLRSWKNKKDGWFGLWCLTPLSTISVISCRTVLLVEETGVPGEIHRPVASHWQTLSHNVVLRTPHLSGIQTHNVSCDRDWLHR
jgi:hypothetical protein